MGTIGDDEDSHQGFGFGPKLVLAGRLKGTVLGRPVELHAEGQELLIRVPNFQTAWSLRGSGRGAASLLRLLSDSGIRLRLQVGPRWMIRVFPNAAFWLRVVAPGLP